MRRLETYLIMIWPWLSLAAACALFSLTIPETVEVQEWIFHGFEIVSLPIWFVSGGVFGLMLSVIWSRWPEQLGKFARRFILAIFGYIAIALVISLVTGTGEGLERISSSGPVKVWAVGVWGLLSIGPTLFGILAIMRNSKWARGASALSFILLATFTMIYAQASRAEVLSQDPVLSLVFVVLLLLFIEGLNWKRKYWEEGGEINMALWRRQASFTFLFLAAASAIALAPFLFSGEIIDYFEGEAMIGKALLGAVLLVPLALAAIVKSLLDRRNKV